MQQDSGAQSAIRKLEQFYAGLTPDEQKVIGLIVSSSLQRAARAQAERDWLKDGESPQLSVSPAAGDKIDVLQADVRIAPHGSRTFLSDGVDNWISISVVS